MDDGGVLLEDYQVELTRFQKSIAEGKADAVEDESGFVLAEMIREELLTRAALKAGFSLDEDGLNKKMEELAASLGGSEKLSDWIKGNGYTDDQFRRTLRRAMAAAWMRDTITAAVPVSAEQVHVRQVLLLDRTEAEYVENQVRSGVDFATIAGQYDSLTRGDLGWFPRGYLTQAIVEEAAFTLQPGEVSGIIESGIGFHIIQVIEKDPQRPLPPDALLTNQKTALKDWLESTEKNSSIQILVNK
jgi:peptidyl-prolyl cis-trans isomerase C